MSRCESTPVIPSSYFLCVLCVRRAGGGCRRLQFQAFDPSVRRDLLPDCVAERRWFHPRFCLPVPRRGEIFADSANYGGARTQHHTYTPHTHQTAPHTPQSSASPLCRFKPSFSTHMPARAPFADARADVHPLFDARPTPPLSALPFSSGRAWALILSHFLLFWGFVVPTWELASMWLAGSKYLEFRAGGAV